MDNNTTTITLKVNGDDAKNKMSQLLDQLTTMRKRLGELSAKPMVQLTPNQKKEVKDLTRSITQTEKELRRMQSSAQAADHVLSQISTANLKELKTTLRDLNRELNSGDITRGSDQWNQLAAKARDIKAEIAKVNEELKATKQLDQDTGEQKSWLRSFGDKWQGLVVTLGGVKGTISSLTSTVMGYYEQYAEMAEHMSDVKKYTGLADDAVRDLNESFKQMDTRTPREQLNDLAADAGRLGIQSKQQILDFVTAADQINVALGEDLGEGAVKNIGKLAQLFGDADRIGLKQAMLSTASIINELAQSSSASEGYLMEFTARLAGVSNQAGLTQAQVMAFGSVLDQSMVGVEKGATALQNVITALFAKPEKMAAAAGLQVKQFTDLLKTDANAALLQFIQALQDTGGFDRLAPLLKEMQLSGSGVTQTLSALANNLDNLRSTQEQATQAFQDGTSVTNEFNTANNTTQARLDKARKAATDLAITLGEQLAPIAEQMLTTSTNIMRMLSTLLPFITTHARQIIALTTAIAAYTIAINLATIRTIALNVAQKALTATVTLCNGAISIARSLGLSLSIAYYSLTGNVTRLRAAQIALNRTLISNPYVAIAAAVTAIGSAIYLWATRERQLTQEQKTRQAILRDNAEAEKQATNSISSQVSKINLLTAIIHDNNRKLSDRQAAIRTLQSIIPSYNANINREGQITRENTQAVRDYIAELKKKALIQATQEQLQQIANEKLQVNTNGYANAVSIRTKRLRDWEAAHADYLKKVAQHKALFDKGYANDYSELTSTPLYGQYMKLQKSLQEAQGWVADGNNRLNMLSRREQALLQRAQQFGASIDQLFEAIDTPTIDTPTNNGGNGGGGSNGTTTGGTTTDDRHAAALAKLEAQQRKEETQAAADYQLGTIQGYQQYQQKLIDIDNAYILKKRDLYRAGDTQLTALDRQQRDNEAKDLRLKQDYSLAAIDTETDKQISALKQRYYQGQLAEEDYQDQLDHIQETRLQRRLQWLRDPANAADPKAIHEAETALARQREQQALTRMERLYQKAKAFRQEYNKQSIDEQEQAELALLDRLTQAFKWSEEQKAKYKQQIQEKYDKKRQEEKDGNPDDTDDQREKRKIKDPLGSPSDEMSQSLISFMRLFDSLILKIKDGQATWQDYAAIAVGALALTAAATSSASQLIQAKQQEEEAAITKRYDTEIQKAGTTTKRGKKLEEQKQKELAQIKTKYNNKQMKIELAQAVATTAMNALKAYGAMADIPIVGPILGAAAAAAAIAAGAIQIASIKKQHAAEAQGYYQGGYTPGTNYRQSAGIVHQGEFVANHQAVSNPAIRPMLDLIDQAQRTNRVATLTPADVSRAIAAPQATAAATSATATAATQTAAATTATAAATPQTTQIITTTTQAQTDTLRRLADQLDAGITATVTIDGPNGLDRQYKKYQRLNTI